MPPSGPTIRRRAPRIAATALLSVTTMALGACASTTTSSATPPAPSTSQAASAISQGAKTTPASTSSAPSSAAPVASVKPCQWLTAAEIKQYGGIDVDPTPSDDGQACTWQRADRLAGLTLAADPRDAFILQAYSSGKGPNGAAPSGVTIRQVVGVGVKAVTVTAPSAAGLSTVIGIVDYGDGVPLMATLMGSSVTGDQAIALIEAAERHRTGH